MQQNIVLNLSQFITYEMFCSWYVTEALHREENDYIKYYPFWHSKINISTSLQGRWRKKEVAWKDVKCLICRYPKKSWLGISNFYCHCWEDSKTLSLNNLPSTLIRLYCKKEKRDKPMFAGKSVGYWRKWGFHIFISLLFIYVMQNFNIFVNDRIMLYIYNYLISITGNQTWWCIKEKGPRINTGLSSEVCM